MILISWVQGRYLLYPFAIESPAPNELPETLSIRFQ